MRNKLTIFVATMLFIVIVCLSASVAIYRSSLHEAHTTVGIEERHHLQIQTRILIQPLEHALAVLDYISGQPGYGQPDRKSEERQRLASIFSMLTKNHHAVSALRILDLKGNEIVRIKHAENGAHIIAQENLQAEAQRDYFKVAGHLQPGEFSISSPESDTVESHGGQQPVIHMAIAAFNKQGQRSGMVVVNLDVASMFRRSKQAILPTAASSVLLDARGHILSGEFSTPLLASSEYITQELWTRITAENKGQFFDNGSMYSFVTIYPLAALAGLTDLHPQVPVASYRWILLSRFPAVTFQQMTEKIRNILLCTDIIILILTSAVVWLLLRILDHHLAVQRQIRESRQHLENMLSVVPAVIFVRSDSSPYTLHYVSQGIKKLLGYRAQDVCRKPEFFLNHIHPHDVDRVKFTLRRSPEQQSIENFRIMNSQGHYQYIQEHSRRIPIGHHTSRERVGAWSDVSDIVMAEAQLRQERDHLTKAQELGKLGNFTVDCESHRQTWSNEIYRLLGVAPGAIPETFDSFMRYVHPDDKEHLTEASQVTFSGMGPLNISYRIIREDGQVRYLHTLANIETDVSGKRMIYGLSQDITEFRLSQHDLENALHAKEILLRELHHRVKNNLQIISSLIGLQAGTAQGNNLGSFIEELQGRIQALSAVHTELLVPEHFERIFADRFIERLLVQIHKTYAAPGFRLHHKMDIDHVLLDIDRATLCGLIVNELLTNVFKYAFAGRAEGELRIGLHDAGDTDCKLTISDDGPGLPADFELESCKTVGLRLVRMLVRQLGGTIEVDTQNGTRFTIRAPWKDATVNSRDT